MVSIISRQELNRMKAMANSQNNELTLNSSSKEAELRKLSQDRISRWPNTLLANRNKKESFAAEKALQRERANLQLDIEEEELRAQQRQDALDRAEGLIYKQTDNMKLLKSQKLLSDVLYSREHQLLEKQRRQDLDREEKERFQELLIAQLKQADELEQLKIDKQKRSVQMVAQTRMQQLEEVKQRRQKEDKEIVELGEELKAKAKLDYANELRKHEENILKMKSANENMIMYNEKLKILRDELQHKERLAQEAREREIGIIEDRKNGRKLIEMNRQANRNQKRQDLIEAATKQLAQTTHKENEILMKQETEIKQRLDQQDMNKLAKQEREWNDTTNSRNNQIEAKKRAMERQRQEDEQQIEIFMKHNDYELNKQKAKHQADKNKEDALKRQQRADAIAYKEMQLMSKAQRQAEERRLLELLKSNDVRFTEICQREIESYQAQGKPLYPLLKTLAVANPKAAAHRIQSNCLPLNVPVV